MPDFTMCKGEDCPMRESCYRYKAEPNSMQSYFVNSPRVDDDCVFWTAIREDDIVNE
jgi:hypothetical protein